MRTTVALRAGLFCLAAATAAAALSVAATNTNRRVDLTLARRHQLAERTQARLKALDTPVELVVAVSRATLDPRQADRVGDVLAALDAASSNLTVTTIDVTGPRGPEQYERLVERLEARDAAGRASRGTESARVAADARTLGADLTALDTAATAAARSIATDPSADPAAARLGEFAAFARVANRQLNETLGAATQPDAGTVRALAELGATLAPQFEALQTELGGMTSAPRARSLLGETARIAATLRARAEALALMAPPESDLDRVADALASGEAALLIGPERTDGSPGLVALDLDALYPPPGVSITTEAAADVRTEQIVAAALTVLTDDARPIVVFLHGEAQRWVGQAGVLTNLIQRMKAAGIDHAEWAAVLDDTPPDLSTLDPAGRRPVVYAVISPNTTASSNPSIPGSTPGTDRAGTVGNAVARLLDAGEPLLLCLNPSVFPTFGDTDPIASLVAPLGLGVRSASPILRTAATQIGPSTTPSSRIVPDEKTTESPIAAALRGLPIAIDWALPMSIDTDRTAAVRPLLTIDEGDAWSESEWLNYWRTPRNQRPLLRDPPVFDADTDDARGPFVVAASIETGATPGGTPTRVVVVGSNTWFLDQAWAAQQRIAGRSVLANPGNPEFFDAAVLWLAGRDELIAPSPAARPIARIGPVSPGVLSLLRWGLIGGVPLLILATGGLWRAVRG